MDTPLGIPRFLRIVPSIGQSIGQVREKHGAVLVADAGLMEINAFVKLAQAFQVFFTAYAAFQGVGVLNLAEGDVVLLPGGKSGFRLFPENGEMAGIVCQPQVAFDQFGTAGIVAKAVEETDGSFRIVKMPEWLRLQPQLHQAAGLPAQHIQESAHGVQPGKEAFFIRMKPAV